MIVVQDEAYQPRDYIKEAVAAGARCACHVQCSCATNFCCHQAMHKLGKGEKGDLGIPKEEAAELHKAKAALALKEAELQHKDAELKEKDAQIHHLGTSSEEVPPKHSQEVVQGLTVDMAKASKAAAKASSAAADAAEAVANSSNPTEEQIEEAEEDSKAAESTYAAANEAKKELQGAIAAAHHEEQEAFVQQQQHDDVVAEDEDEGTEGIDEGDAMHMAPRYE